MFVSNRMRAALATLAIGALVGGFINLGYSLRYMSPRTVTYAQLISQNPQEGWYAVQGGYLDIPDAFLPYGGASGYYVPLLPNAGGQSTPPIYVFVDKLPLLQQLDAYNYGANKPVSMWGQPCRRKILNRSRWRPKKPMRNWTQSATSSLSILSPKSVCRNHESRKRCIKSPFPLGRGFRGRFLI
jgi:hypothetical protein